MLPCLSSMCACLSICLFVFLSFYISVRLSSFLSIYTSLAVVLLAFCFALIFPFSVSLYTPTCLYRYICFNILYIYLYICFVYVCMATFIYCSFISSFYIYDIYVCVLRLCLALFYSTYLQAALTTVPSHYTYMWTLDRGSDERIYVVVAQLPHLLMTRSEHWTRIHVRLPSNISSATVI